MDDQLKLLSHLLDAQTFALRTALAYQFVLVEILKSIVAGKAVDSAKIAAMTKELGNDAAEMKTAVDAAKQP